MKVIFDIDSVEELKSLTKAFNRNFPGNIQTGPIRWGGSTLKPEFKIMQIALLALKLSRPLSERFSHEFRKLHALILAMRSLRVSEEFAQGTLFMLGGILLRADSDTPLPRIHQSLQWVLPHDINAVSEDILGRMYDGQIARVIEEFLHHSRARRCASAIWPGRCDRNQFAGTHRRPVLGKVFLYSSTNPWQAS